MIESLTVQNFKSFAETDNVLKLGPLSLIIGTNASGKSNLRDALRFIHGLSRGYSLAEIIGEKYVEGGVLQWKGIRGGVRETVRKNPTDQKNFFRLQVVTQLDEEPLQATYSITVDVGDKNVPPYVRNESLVVGGRGNYIFNTDPDGQSLNSGGDSRNITAQLRKESRGFVGPRLSFRADQPILTQIFGPRYGYDETHSLHSVRTYVPAFFRTIASIRFLDLEPNALRRPSIPGQTVLGDKGENLSSVLQAICSDPVKKQALIEWTRELTPLDVTDFKFPEVSLEGKIQLQLVESERDISAESASDGTLRFLAFAAALLGPDPARCYFFEELENGIHPNRTHLLIDLLKTATRDGKIQIIGTTHSPALLNYIDDEIGRKASITYRKGPVSKIKSLNDIPELWKIAPTAGKGQLLESGWFDIVLSYMEGRDGK
jgi:predicted ATPase